MTQDATTKPHITEGLQALAEPIDTLHPLPGNPRRGRVDAIARILARFGQRKPIVANRHDRTVLAGNHTLAAAQQLGWDHIAVTWVDDDDATAKAFSLADNRASDLGDYDNDLLAEMIADVQGIDPALLADTGWDDDSVTDLLASLNPDFEPEGDDEDRLDLTAPKQCPNCGFEWRDGPAGEVIPA